MAAGVCGAVGQCEWVSVEQSVSFQPQGFFLTEKKKKTLIFYCKLAQHFKGLQFVGLLI